MKTQVSQDVTQLLYVDIVFTKVMSHMSFNDHTSKLMYTLGEVFVSHLMFNGGVTQHISIRKLDRQGCRVSPLLFTIMTSPILIKLHYKVVK